MKTTLHALLISIIVGFITYASDYFNIAWFGMCVSTGLMYLYLSIILKAENSELSRKQILIGFLHYLVWAFLGFGVLYGLSTIPLLRPVVSLGMLLYFVSVACITNITILKQCTLKEAFLIVKQTRKQMIKLMFRSFSMLIKGVCLVAIGVVFILGPQIAAVISSSSQVSTQAILDVLTSPQSQMIQFIGTQAIVLTIVAMLLKQMHGILKNEAYI